MCLMSMIDVLFYSVKHLVTSSGRIQAKPHRPQTARRAEAQAQCRGCGVGLTVALCTDTKSGGFTSRG